MAQCAGVITVTACVDSSAARAQQLADKIAAAGFPKPATFTSLAAAIECGGFEAVDLMLPHHLHLPLSKQCFDAGLHVLLEKPLAAKLDDALELLSAGRKAVSGGLAFMIAENSQYWPEVLCAKRLIDEGAIGTVLSARAIFKDALAPDSDATVDNGADVSKSYAKLEGDEAVWRFDKELMGGGIVIDGGAQYSRDSNHHRRPRVPARAPRAPRARPCACGDGSLPATTARASLWTAGSDRCGS